MYSVPCRHIPFMQHRINVDAMSRRLYNVALTAMQRHDVAPTLMRRCIKAFYTAFFIFYFIVSGEISVYLMKIKVVSITSELISYHFTSD